MVEKITDWIIKPGRFPVVATAIHHGHQIREELLEFLAISEAERRREEDPQTGYWTEIDGCYSVVCQRSRFEVDLNRPRNRAVYLRPEDSWNLTVWKENPPQRFIDQSLKLWDRFYRDIFQLLKGLENEFGGFVVLDLHSYNHRRDGVNAPAADPVLNPEINVGTGTMNRRFWSPVVDRLMRELSHFDFSGRRLDVRENIRFQGGHFPGWIHKNFPESGCALPIEMKKFFMDEWTGEVDESAMIMLRETLSSSVPGILRKLQEVIEFRERT